MKKSIIALFILIALCTGCSEGTAISQWAKNLTVQDITSAFIWDDGNGGWQTAELDESEKTALIQHVNALTVSAFTLNKGNAGITPAFGVGFTRGETAYSINQADGPYGPLEIRFEGKQWWISSDGLYNYINELREKLP